MINLTEKLELMTYLHQQGLQPEMWLQANGKRDIESKNPRIVLLDNATALREVGKSIETLAYPWFPLEHVLELLEKVNFDDQDGEAYFLPLPCRWSITCFNGGEYFYQDWGNDPHLAALKLLKQVMEKYPEAVKRETTS